MQNRIIRLLVLPLLMLWGQLQASGGELLLIYQKGDHEVSKDFQDNYIPKIEAMAKEQGIVVKQVEITGKAPKGIQATPAIVFQNHLGRSVYTGRYHYVNKIKTFIRTVKRMPQRNVENEKHDVLVWKNGGSTVLTPIKIGSLSGVVPKGFDSGKFKKGALKAISKGMGRYKYAAKYLANRPDRLMYSAFYPHRSEDGKLYISVEIYSQFSCVDPVFKQFESPIQGDWGNWEGVFVEAAALVEQHIVAELNNPARGDGMLPLPKSVKTVSFEEMGLPLPDAPVGASTDFSAIDLKIAQKWTMEGPIAEDVPVINFSFPAPLDYYAGEITEMIGFLNLGSNASILKSLAAFSASMESLTMGDPSLDHSIADMVMLADYPKATFSFESIEVIDQPVVTFGAVSQFIVHGQMDFKGIKIPLDVVAEITPTLNEAGEPRLQVFATFKLPLKRDFDINGPDGPAEASDFLDYNLNFLLKPAA